MSADVLAAVALIISALGGTIITPIVIAYFGRKTVQATTAVAESSAEAVQVSKATLVEVQTANAKPSGGVVDAIWDEQIRLKKETGTELEGDEVEHADSMARHKAEEGKDA